MAIGAALLALAVLACGGEAPTERPRCAQCGMYADGAPAWRGDAEDAQGHTLAFCSPKCLLRHRAAHAGEIRNARLRDYYGQAERPVTELWYVRGSDLRSPMGDDLVPLGDEAAATEFAADHGGEALSFESIDGTVLQSLDP